MAKNKEAGKELKRLTLKDLIAAKVQRENSRISFKDIYVKSLDGIIQFRKPSDSDILDTMDKIGNDVRVSEVIQAFKFLIYQSCDMLHNAELHKEYEVKDPLDIVDKLFELGDKLNIGNELLEMSGLDKIELDETVKN